jgi:glycosyltransferase involved in cell wall biosynthesis
MTESPLRRPLLSICLPTYNRVDCLEIALNALIAECAHHGKNVEIIVADNASTDSTRKLKKKYDGCDFVRWYQRCDNIGAPANVASCAMELAQGEFCWIIGDDDLVLPGGVGQIIKALQSHPEIGIFFVNFAAVDYAVIKQHASNSIPIYQPNYQDLECKVAYNQIYLSAIDFLQTGQGRCDYFSAIVGLVIETNLWKKYALAPAELSKDKHFSSFDISFPHLAPVFHSPSTSPVFYLATPVCLLGMGMREWIHEWSGIVSNQFPHIIELYSKIGASVGYTDLMRLNLWKLLLMQLPNQIRGGVPWAEVAAPLWRRWKESSFRTRKSRAEFLCAVLSVLPTCFYALLDRGYGRLPMPIKSYWRKIKVLTYVDLSSRKVIR